MKRNKLPSTFPFKHLYFCDVRHQSWQALRLRTSFAQLGDGVAYDYHDALCKCFSLVVDSRKLKIERARGQLDRKHVKAGDASNLVC